MKAEQEVLNIGELDFSFRDEILALPGGENIMRCFACGTCSAGCPVTEIDEEYNCRQIIRKILFGLKEEVLSSPTIWLCLECYRCTARCPQKVNFTDIMRILRYLAVKHNYIAPETVAKVRNIDSFIQQVRRDFIRHEFQPDQDFKKKLKAMIEEKTNG